MANNDGLTRQGIAFKASKKSNHVRDVFRRRKFTIHSVFKHDIFDHFSLGDFEGSGLLGDLLVNERGSDKTWTYNVCTHAFGTTFLGNDPGEAQDAMLGCDIGCF